MFLGWLTLVAWPAMCLCTIKGVSIRKCVHAICQTNILQNATLHCTDGIPCYKPMVGLPQCCANILLLHRLCVSGYHAPAAWHSAGSFWLSSIHWTLVSVDIWTFGKEDVTFRQLLLMKWCIVIEWWNENVLRKTNNCMEWILSNDSRSWIRVHWAQKCESLIESVRGESSIDCCCSRVEDCCLTWEVWLTIRPMIGTDTSR